MKIINKEFGIFINLTSEYCLYICILTPVYGLDGYLSRYDYGHEAFKESLESLKEKYPEIRYDGLILYIWSDWHDGGLIMYNISSDDTNKDKTYDFIGEKLSDIFEDAAKIIGDDFDEDNIIKKGELLIKKSNIDYSSFWDYLLAGSGLKDKAIDSLKAYSDYINEDVFNNIINFITIHFKTYPY